MAWDYGIAKEGSRLGDSLKNFGRAVGDSFVDFFKSDQDAARDALKRTNERALDAARAELAAKDVAKIRAQIPPVNPASTNGFVKGVKSFARFGVRVAELPVAAFVLKPMKWVANGGTALFTKFHKAAPVGLVFGGLVAGGTWLTHRRSQVLQQQADMLSQLQAMNESAGGVPAPAGMGTPPLTYMNSASQAEVDARIAQDKASAMAPASKADAITAARTAVPAPGTAQAI